MDWLRNLGIKPSLGSPHTPLLGFETTGGTVDDPEYTKAAAGMVGGHHISCESMWLQSSPLGGSEANYVAPSIARATLKAISAYGRSPEDATRLAREALAIDPRCPEAYNVLATHAAKSLQEALDFYNEGIRQAPLILSEPDFVRASTEGQAFMVPPMRALFRCINGAAIVLFKMGRDEESYTQFQRLRKLDDHGYRYSSYTNFRYHLPILLLRYKGVAFAEKYMHRLTCSENYTLTSTQCSWVYTQALIDFKKVGRPFFPWHYFTMVRAVEKTSGGHQNEATDSAQEEICRAGGAILMALQQAPLVMKLLAGERQLPKGHLPITFTGVDDMVQAVACVHAVGDLWKKTPGAIEWALQCRNVWQIALMLREVKGYGPYNKEKLKTLFAKGGFKLPGLKPQDAYERDLILIDALACKGATGEVINLLVQEGGCDVSAVDATSFQPINKALYYDRPPSIVQALIRNGAQVPRPTQEEFSPLAMAVNQGNHLALRAALDVLPAIAADTAELRCLYMELFQTNCFLCIKGMLSEKCQRCRFEPESPHSREISFEKCVDVLAECGLRLDSALERAAQQEIHHPLQVGLVERLRMQGKLIARRKKLAGGVEDLRIGPSDRAEASGKAESGAGGSGRAENGVPGKGKKKKKKAAAGAAACGSCGKSDVKILRCSKCNVAGYCSAECQKVEWPRHKIECKALAAQGNAN